MYDILNLPPSNRETAAIYNNTDGHWYIGSVAFDREYVFGTTYRLTPVQKPRQGYSHFTGDGVKATLVQNGNIFDTNVTVLTRSDTWENYERLSR